MKLDFKEKYGLFRIIQDDIEFCILKINSGEEPIDYYLRSYIRSYAAWIEGMIFLYKDLIRNIEDKWHLNLPIESQLYLFEADWKIKHNGKPEIYPKKIPTKDNLKSFFFVMSQIFNDFPGEVSGADWERIVHFYKIRDKMMHPTEQRHLKLSRQDLEKCEKGRLWLNERIFQLGNCYLERVSGPGSS